MTTFTDKELIKEIKERIGSLDVRDHIERRAYEIALASLEAEPVAECIIEDGGMCVDGFGEYVGHSLPDGTHQLYAVPPMRLPDGLEAAAVAWKVVFTQVDQESNTFTAMYSDKAEVERWVRLHEVADFRADITPLYAAPVVPVAVNDDMAHAFHHALSDSSLGADEVEEIKTGLRAAFANVTTQSAQVVPEFETWFNSQESGRSICSTQIRRYLQEISWNACRAAMLQGKGE
ncbi:hypothetical protein GNO57_18170 [Escherichia coli]|nr:hypothetical protein [Escherichia coli]